MQPVGYSTGKDNEAITRSASELRSLAPYRIARQFKLDSHESSYIGLGYGSDYISAVVVDMSTPGRKIHRYLRISLAKTISATNFFHVILPVIKIRT